MKAAELLVPAAAAAATLPRTTGWRATRHLGRVGHARASRGPSQAGHPAMFPVAGLVVAGFVGGLALVVIVAAVLVIGRAQVRAWQQRRVARRIIDELPSALHNIARRLRSGYPASLGFAEVLGSTRASVGGTFAASMLARGEPLLNAVDRWRSDVDAIVGPTVLEDLLHVVALSTRVGGLQASAIEVLAEIASERHALEQETKAQASQAKASATVMTIAPLLFSAQMVLRDPAASRLLLHTPIGWTLIALGLSFNGVAWLWIRRATSTRVKRAASSARRASRKSDAGSAIRRVLRWVVFGANRRTDRLIESHPGAKVVGHDRQSPRALERLGGAIEAIIAAAAKRIALRSFPSSTGPAALPTPESRWGSWSVELRRRVGLAALILPPLLMLRPVLGALALVTLAVGPYLHRRFSRQRAQHERSGAVAQTTELLRLALECGSSPSLAIVGVAEVCPPPLRPALATAADGVRQGLPFPDVTRRLIVDAPELRAMADVLAASHRLGLPIAETLRGLAVEARASRRRDAEARARRLPVVLLFPVVCLTLPAFVLLTVAPLLLSGLGALHF